MTLIKRKIRSITIAPELDVRLVNESKLQNRKISNLLSMIVEEYLDRKEKKRKKKNKR